MPYVIAEPFIEFKDKSRVAVCPVDCIHEGTVDADGVTYDQLFIDPDECIDCGLCEPECPVDAIFMGDEMPEHWKRFTQINAEFYKSGTRKR